MKLLPTSWTALALLAAAPAAAQEPPSYARHIRPFLAKYCIECHNPGKLSGGLDLETFKGLQAGAEGEPVVVPGKAGDSRVVRSVEAKRKPRMPPKTAKQPPPAEVAVLRAWVAAGAKDDSGSIKVVLPPIRPRVPVAAPVAAAAYHPSWVVPFLAAAGRQEVALVNADTGAVAGKLPGQTGRVTALAFGPDGRLAVAAGDPATAGAVRLYAFTPGPPPRADLERTLAAHKDVIHGLSFSPDGKLLATCGYDRLVKLWDAAGGKLLHTLKEHSDAVYGVAFSPDGKLLASAAADRAVKVWDVAAGKLLFTLGEATDWLYTVAWSREHNLLAAAGVDRSIRVWQVTATGGKLLHSVFAHEGPVTRLVYGGPFDQLYSAGEDRVVKVWDPQRMVERHVFDRQQEAVLALAVRPGYF